MKKFPALLILVSLCISSLFSQTADLKSTLPTDSDDKIRFQKIFEVDLEQRDAYEKCREWFKNATERTGAYATTQNFKSGRVSGKGHFEFTHTLLTVPYKYKIHYILAIDAKDKKVRISFSDFIIEEKASKSNSWKAKEWEAEKNIHDDNCYNKKGKVKANCKKFKGPILDFVQKITNRFEKFLEEGDDF